MDKESLVDIVRPYGFPEVAFKPRLPKNVRGLIGRHDIDFGHILSVEAVAPNKRSC